MTYRQRKRWALVVLLVGLPLYIVVALTVVGLFERPSVWLELAIYVGLGLAWALPFRGLFKGVARPDPEAAGPEGPGSDAPGSGR